MIQKFLLFTFLCFFCQGFAQYNFSGQIADNVAGETVYLSIIEDYRKLSRPYFEQIIKKTNIDSLGFFRFEGDNLSTENRLYRIHIDGCSDHLNTADHFFGQCEYAKSILFIANNKDTVSFPTSFADEILCEITSTNVSSNAILEIDAMKEKMALDFYDYPSVANRKLNSKKWFTKFQNFGSNLQEPLAELYIYDFLSDKRNETYGYYLKDLQTNPYYSNLKLRLDNFYSNTTYAEFYGNEIATDKRFSEGQTANTTWSKFIWPLIAVLSVLLNIYFLVLHKNGRKRKKQSAWDKLTTQEQNIVTAILKNKTNKEIASDLFISLSTVKTHINNLYKKLNVSTREEIKQLMA